MGPEDPRSRRGQDKRGRVPGVQSPAGAGLIGAAAFALAFALAFLAAVPFLTTRVVLRGGAFFFAGRFFAGRFFAGRFFAERLFAGSRASRSRNSSTACSRSIDSGSTPRGKVALIDPSVTYGP